MRMVQSIIIRLLDIVLSFMAIAGLTPFMIPIVIGLLLTGEHHVFYKQKRIGRRGKPFYLYKFATMLEDSINMQGGSHTLKDDPRILPMGRFLRKTKINELPQLINILKGDMSVIGYRPVGEVGYHFWPEWAKDKLRDSKPGLSGIGSIVFRNEEEIIQNVNDDKDDYYRSIILPYKMELECWYQDNKSIKMYGELIILTIDAVFGKDTWKKYIKDLPQIPEVLADVL